MTKLKRTEDGGYIIKGKKYETLRGTRRQVHEYETAYKTAGGLLKGDLVQNKKGRIVSKAKFDEGPNLLKNLTKRGFFTKKGKFGHTKMKTRKLRKKLTRKNRRKMKGGDDNKPETSSNKIEELKKMIEPISEDAIRKKIPESISQDMINSLLKPLEPLFEAKKELDTKLVELEKALDAGQEKLDKKVEEINELIDEELGEKKINDLIDNTESPNALLTAQIESAKILFKPIIQAVMKPIREDMKKKIKEIAESPISKVENLNTETPGEEKTESTNEEEEENTESTKEEEENTESTNQQVVEAQEKVEKTLSHEDQEKFKQKMEIYKTTALNEFADEKNRAKLAAAQFEDSSFQEPKSPSGGKKKSKGKNKK